MTTASMAYLPERVNADNTNSIRCQVSMLHQYRGDNKLGDANKFRGVINRDGFLFTVDDDLLYPPDYIEFMIRKILQYDKKAVITLHGKVLKRQPISSFYGRDFTKYRCFQKVERDTPVHIPGTGVMGWHSSALDLSLEDFKEKNMADIWMGIACEKQGVQRICAAHPAGWIKRLGRHEFTCYDSNRKRDQLLTDTINSIEWKPLS